MPTNSSPKLFTRFAKATSAAAGNPITFGVALGTIIVWGISGPIFGYSDTWQLIINTSTTIVTFLMVFLIQNSQNRDSYALQVKLDELLRVTEGAHVALLDLEELEEHELNKIRQNYTALACEARKRLDKGESDTDIPEVSAECVAASS